MAAEGWEDSHAAPLHPAVPPQDQAAS